MPVLTINELIKKYNVNTEHSQQVWEYCEKLVNALDSFIGFTNREREYLYCAAMLHDVGYFVEKKSHHKHSLEIISQQEIEGFSKDEVEVIANIARYHRNSLPDEEKHLHFAKLPQENKKIVCKLASILKIADGMDKPHKNLILRIEVQETDTSFEFYIKTVGFKPKLDSAKLKSDLFESTFKKNVNFNIL